MELLPASEVLVGCSSGLEAAFEPVLVEPSGSKRHKLSAPLLYGASLTATGLTKDSGISLAGRFRFWPRRQLASSNTLASTLSSSKKRPRRGLNAPIALYIFTNLLLQSAQSKVRSAFRPELLKKTPPLLAVPSSQ